uniref:TF_AP-2 domain-containing protein n=1 Tax=Ascaris lumbricoides TaxID=6252 RepID=A0A0M3IN60_ASCLU
MGSEYEVVYGKKFLFFSEEALHMARDFATLCEKDFPVRHMAEYACKKSIWQEDIERRRIMIEHTKIVLKELVDIVNADRSPICGSQPPVILASSMQQRLTHFSMVRFIGFFFA